MPFRRVWINAVTAGNPFWGQNYWQVVWGGVFGFKGVMEPLHPQKKQKTCYLYRSGGLPIVPVE